jgi:hypothetical protein
MLRQSTSRIRAHITSSLLIHQIRRFFTLDISAAKAAATHWDPALQIPTNSRQNDTPDAEDVETYPWMTTYSAFDPGMIRPLLLMGGVVLNMHVSASFLREFCSGEEGNDGEVKAKLADHEDAENDVWMTTYSAFDPGMIRPLLPVVKQSGFTVKTKEIKEMKPWPYSLPVFLQPKAGTTYDSTMHGGAEQSKVSRRVGVLQAVLHGIPEPDKVEAKKGVLYKLVYGVKEDEEEKKDDEVVGE